MVEVKVIFPGYFAKKTNKKEVNIKLSHGNVGELIFLLASRFPNLSSELMASELMEGGRLSSNYFLAVNNEMIPASTIDELSACPLKDGDEITFVFAIAGG